MGFRYSATINPSLSVKQQGGRRRPFENRNNGRVLKSQEGSTAKRRKWNDGVTREEKNKLSNFELIVRVKGIRTAELGNGAIVVSIVPQ